ncbi:conserved hypothetical protein [Theileria equi strain WA]|uniref:Signal peptide containing protein n=1 Tax=Theileria equi strain WA TaxID=1537102 RepID=L1LF76_THEEQ|nr:conserved hypothetical protein [Theileria equi strain WA]EKX74092.1 conserved hypothetical protein [Theileria equi strain WA]|eukprot:XP_004833544.1 conserved hypothetical protein [Theileria equi strain WA]
MNIFCLLYILCVTDVFSYILTGLNSHARNGRVWMSWGYPIFDDGPRRKRRRKVDQAFERGPMRINTPLIYQYANRLAQNTYHVPGYGILPYIQEEGLGASEDVYTSPETACGGIDIDEEEFEKIKSVYKIFNDNGCGVLKIIGAKSQHFAFLYSGPIKEKHGIKCYLRFLINRVYPGSKVTVLTDLSSEESIISKGVDDKLFGKQKRMMITGRDYYESHDDGLPSDTGPIKKFDMLT